MKFHFFGFGKRSALRLITLYLVCLVCALSPASLLAQARRDGAEPILFVVLDPLSRELACACVKGFGQRDYRKLAAHIEKAVSQRVSIEFSDDLAETLAQVGSPRSEVIVVGDRSLVAAGAKKAELKCQPVCELSGLDGTTTLGGLFLARSDDSVRELKDIGARKILFGLAEADQKYAASLDALREAGIQAPRPEKHLSYSDAALDLLDSDLSPPPVAVVPSYALRLLESCGSVKPGNLRVIGKTEPTPFITAFVSDNIAGEKREKIVTALLSVKDDSNLLTALESKNGFKPLTAEQAAEKKPRAAADWPDWRGPRRDGHVQWLPKQLPTTPKLIWKKAAMPDCLAGLSVADGRLILAERDFADAHDVYRCLNADTGELLWRVQFPARGQLDYGQSPRATPVIHAGKAYLLGAFGDLRCVSLADGKLIWERNLPREFKASLPTWGMCSPPLVVDNLLIVNPGATNASLAALDCAIGRTRWTTPGSPAAYAAFISAELGGRRQIVGYDHHSLGGWDVKTGRRLWQLLPTTEGDFNVPTPIAVDGGIVVATENNGTRFYQFDGSGRVLPKAVAQFADLSPDTSSPVVASGRVFGADQGLFCLDLKQGLKPVWQRDESSIGDHASLISDDERVLVITVRGELILLDAKADNCAIISRTRLFEDDVEVYSHPALVGTRLYARGGPRVVCLDLAMN